MVFNLLNVQFISYSNFLRIFLEKIFHIEKELNVHFDGHTSSTKETFTMFILRCVSNFFFQNDTGDPNISHFYLKSQGTDNIPITNIRVNRLNVL